MPPKEAQDYPLPPDPLRRGGGLDHPHPTPPLQRLPPPGENPGPPPAPPTLSYIPKKARAPTPASLSPPPGASQGHAPLPLHRYVKVQAILGMTPCERTLLSQPPWGLPFPPEGGLGMYRPHRRKKESFVLLEEIQKSHPLRGETQGIVPRGMSRTNAPEAT